MSYELANDLVYTGMVARNLVLATDRERLFYGKIARELGCSLSNAIGCVSLLMLEKVGAAIPTELYGKLISPSPRSTAFLAQVRAGVIRD